MAMSYRVGLLWCAAVAVFSSGCDDTSSCSPECPAGQTCVDSVCRPLCYSSSDCVAEQICVSGRCEAYMQECERTEDCATGWFCSTDKRCLRLLPNGATCGTDDGYCQSGACVDGVCCAPGCSGDSCSSCVAAATHAGTAQNALNLTCDGCIDGSQLRSDLNPAAYFPICSADEMPHSNGSAWECSAELSVSPTEHTVVAQQRLGVARQPASNEQLSVGAGVEYVHDSSLGDDGYNRCGCDVDNTEADCPDPYATETGTDDRCVDQLVGASKVFRKVPGRHPLPALTVTDTGRVGVLTSTPSARLDVKGDIAAERFIGLFRPHSFVWSQAVTARTDFTDVSLGLDATQAKYVMAMVFAVGSAADAAASSDHVNHVFGRSLPSCSTWNNAATDITATNMYYACASDTDPSGWVALTRDGELSSDTDYYGEHEFFIIPLKANHRMTARLADGYSAGTHYVKIRVIGYIE